jgi:hypothetical protein
MSYLFTLQYIETIAVVRSMMAVSGSIKTELMELGTVGRTRILFRFLVTQVSNCYQYFKSSLFLIRSLR